MLYLIHAYESIYQGLHGMEEFEVIEEREGIENELWESYVIPMSYDVMGSYECIADDLIEAARSQLELDGIEEGSEEYDEKFEEVLPIEYDNNIDGAVYVLSDEIKSIKEAEEKISEIGIEKFVDLYTREGY